MIAYAILTLAMWIAWLRLQAPMPTSASSDLPVTVIIVVRNEEENIVYLLEDIEKQCFPAANTQVIVVDDHSTDNTVQYIETFSRKATYSLHLLHLHEYIQAHIDENYKKKAIELAVREASGKLIICTDGDCRVGCYWLQTITDFYLTTGAHFISGPVSFYQEKSFFEKLQTVEFASLIGSGAALLNLGLPAMCNGANLAFTKEAFTQVGGYAQTANTATGDDVFLLQKIHKAYPGKVGFLKSRQAVVYTEAKATLALFVQQRKRWASKWNVYINKKVSFLAVFIFVSNFSVFVALLLLLWGNYPLRMFLLQIAIKFSVEVVFLISVLTFFHKAAFAKYILPLQGIYFLYVSFFGIITHKKGYQWKGRKLS